MSHKTAYSGIMLLILLVGVAGTGCVRNSVYTQITVMGKGPLIVYGTDALVIDTTTGMMVVDTKANYDQLQVYHTYLVEIGGVGSGGFIGIRNVVGEVH